MLIWFTFTDIKDYGVSIAPARLPGLNPVDFYLHNIHVYSDQIVNEQQIRE